MYGEWHSIVSCPGMEGWKFNKKIKVSKICPQTLRMEMQKIYIKCQGPKWGRELLIPKLPKKY